MQTFRKLPNRSPKRPAISGAAARYSVAIKSEDKRPPIGGQSFTRHYAGGKPGGDHGVRRGTQGFSQALFVEEPAHGAGDGNFVICGQQTSAIVLNDFR